MHRIYLIIILVFFVGACKNNNQKAREPIQHRKSTVDMESVRKNKDLNQREEAYIKKMIQQDSLHHYIDSGHGFWYYYVTKTGKGTVAQPDDKVLLTYEIKDLSNNIIYSFDEIGKKWYHVDHENYFRGFREAVKLLKEGEKAVFLFPSNAAYGFHGDEKRIGINIPLIVSIKIFEIKKHKTP